MTRDKVIQIARAEVGTKELPANSNKTKYGKWYGLDGNAWCAMYVSWVFDQAGLRLTVGQTAKGYHHCQSANNIWKGKQRFTQNPKQGDIVLFDWQSDGWADHTGIFVKWNNAQKTEFTCIEGNTSLTNNSNGGMVMERLRYKNNVKAFVCPMVFDLVDAQVKRSMTIGDRGSEVTQVQTMLADLGYATMADGWFGNNTAISVKAFQKDNLMAETGEVDEGTLGALQEEVNRKRIARSKLTTGTYLSMGDSGLWVTELQKALNKKGASPQLGVDGQFGKGTKDALKAFQKSKGLTADGVAGPQTYKALGMI